MSKKITPEEFFRRAKETWGDRWDYSETFFQSFKSKISIICPKHGKFNQLAVAHLRGFVGCAPCTGNINIAKTTEDFLREAQEVWGNRWDYGEVEYRSNNKKVKIVCVDHGVFEQAPSKHLAGQTGCSGCNGRKPSTSQFVKKSKEVWGDRWDYSISNYINANTPVAIICKEHGKFEQLPWNHYRKKVGCSECSGVGISKEVFLEQARSVWRDRWDYSLVNYINKETPITIICKEHGEFEHMPYLHLLHVGCLGCNGIYLGLERFLERAKDVWGDRWDYSKTVYTNIKDTIVIICNDHGEFKQNAETHLLGQIACKGCQQVGTSNGEKEVFEFLKPLVPDLRHRERFRLNGSELEADMYSPSLQVAVEYNGNYWHSSVFKDSKFHSDKKKAMNSIGIRLIQIWEDDWRLKRPIVEEHLKRVFRISSQRKIGARTIEVKESSFEEAKYFLDLNHIQGSVRASYYIGGFYKGDLVALAAFRKRGEDYELSRYATSAMVQGGHSKLVSFFEENYDYRNLITFADLTLSDGDLYRNTGWREVGIIPPDYKYLIKGVREHKFNYRISRFKKDPELKFEEGLTERELAAMNGLLRVYDAGKIKFIKPHP